MQNIELKNIKSKTIAAIDYSSQIFTYTHHITFHGFPLLLQTNSEKMSKLIKRIIPKLWQKSTTKNDRLIILSLFSNEEFGIEDHQWTDEPEQDCYFESELIFQRDFVAKRINNNYTIVTSQNETDGLHNFLRMIIPKLLFKDNRYILHSSCVLNRKNEALIFLGHSGHGKTTICELSGERKILNDDMNIICMNTFLISSAALGHQYCNIESYDANYPIKAIYWLHQSEKNSIEPLNIELASLKILSSMTNIFDNDELRESHPQIISDSIKIAKNIPANILNFKKDQSVWALLD